MLVNPGIFGLTLTRWMRKVGSKMTFQWYSSPGKPQGLWFTFCEYFLVKPCVWWYSNSSSPVFFLSYLPVQIPQLQGELNSDWNSPEIDSTKKCTSSKKVSLLCKTVLRFRCKNCKYHGLKQFVLQIYPFLCIFNFSFMLWLREKTKIEAKCIVNFITIVYF